MLTVSVKPSYGVSVVRQLGNGMSGFNVSGIRLVRTVQYCLHSCLREAISNTLSTSGFSCKEFLAVMLQSDKETLRPVAIVMEQK